MRRLEWVAFVGAAVVVLTAACGEAIESGEEGRLNQALTVAEDMETKANTPGEPVPIVEDESPLSTERTRAAHGSGSAPENVAQLRDYILQSRDDCKQKQTAIARLGGRATAEKRGGLEDILTSDLPALCLEQAASTAISIGNRHTLRVLDELTSNHPHQYVRYAARMAASKLREKHEEFRSGSLELEIVANDPGLNTFQLQVTIRAKTAIPEARLSLLVPGVVESVGNPLQRDFRYLEKGGTYSQVLTFEASQSEFAIPLRAKLRVRLGKKVNERIETGMFIKKEDGRLTDEPLTTRHGGGK